jgi:hypothetical protein
MLSVSEVERQAAVEEALWTAAEREEKVFRQIVNERIDDENYKRWVEMRAVCGDY